MDLVIKSSNAIGDVKSYRTTFNFVLTAVFDFALSLK